VRAEPGLGATGDGRSDDVVLTADQAFAVLRLEPQRAAQLGVTPEELRSLPGYFRAGGEVQAWLSPSLKELIARLRLRAAPAVLDAIDADVADANRARPLATELELASSCSDPAWYPAALVDRLRQLGLVGGAEA
jgi:hypothetical protein